VSCKDVRNIDYSALGQRTQVTLPNGIVAYYSYDGRNRMTKLEHKDGSTVVEGYAYGLVMGDNARRLRQNSVNRPDSQGVAPRRTGQLK
jgi:YD repeat-containing protein